MLLRQEEPKTLKFDSPSQLHLVRPVQQVRVCATMPAFIHLFWAGADGSLAAAARAVSADKGSGSPLVCLWYNSVFLSERSQKKTQRKGVEEDERLWLWAKRQRERTREVDLHSKCRLIGRELVNEWLFFLKCGLADEKCWEKDVMCIFVFSRLSLSAVFLLCSAAQRDLPVGQLCTASRLLRAKCWVNTGCVWGLELLCTSPLCSPGKEKHISAAVVLTLCCCFTKRRPLLSLLKLIFLLSSFLPPLQSVPLSLGSVVPWPSPPWASRPLTLAWSLTSTSKSRPQVRQAVSVCFSSLFGAWNLWYHPKNKYKSWGVITNQALVPFVTSQRTFIYLFFFK